MLNQGLLWKEWVQYRWYFLLAFIIIGLDPVVLPIIMWILQGSGKVVSLAPDVWSNGIKHMLGTGGSNPESWAMIAVVILAAVMLGGERGSSLNYLVTTPVSRCQIIEAKFMVGGGAIIAMMLLLTLFMLAAPHFYPARYTSHEVVLWALLTTAALLCLFSLALLTAAFSGGVLSSALFTAIIMGLPWLLVSLLLHIISRFCQISSTLAIKARYITYLFIPDYITRDGRYISYGDQVLDRTIPDYPLEITILLAACLLFFALARQIFARNPLEKQGELLLFGNFKHIGQISLSFLMALAWAGEVASSGAWFWFYLAVMWLGLYLAIAVIWRLLRWLNFRGEE